MGQYYLIANFTKKEFLNPHSLHCGAKLTEWTWIGNSLSGQLHSLLRKDGTWHGDEVMIVGDYENESLPGGPREGDQFSHIVTKLHERYKVTSIYEMCRNFFKDISEERHQGDNPRYYINHGTKEFIDTEKCPSDWAFYFSDDDCGSVSVDPLPLLLSISNGSGGAYRGNNAELVGLWAEQSKLLELTDDLKDIPEGYTEFAPDFTELKSIVPFTERENVIAKAKKQFVESNGKLTMAEAG